MSYAILRVEKCKSIANVASRAAHNMRASAQAAPHADPAKRDKNRIEIGPESALKVVAAVERRLGKLDKPPRKNAVLAVEVLMTASPEFFESRSAADKNGWAEKSLSWLRATWGEENIISCVLHQDEKTPHLQALVVPINEGKLRASHWLDGPAKLSTLQDSYAEALSSLAIRRGVRNSKAEHVPLRKFYDLSRRVAAHAKQQKKPELLQLPERSVLGRVSADDWQQLEEAVQRQNSELLRLRSEIAAARIALDSAVGVEARKRAQELKKQAEEAEAKLKALKAQKAQEQAEIESLRQERDRLSSEHQMLKVLNDDVMRQIERNKAAGQRPGQAQAPAGPGQRERQRGA
jgi:hypothetical protein